MNKRKSGDAANRLTYLLLLTYAVTLVWILIFKLGVRFSYMDNRSVNLVPFGASAMSHGRLDWSELILNALIFVPLGVYAGILAWRWSFAQKLAAIFSVSLLLESTQYIFRIGAFDTTDLITNTSGGLIGLLLFGVLEKLFSTRTRAQRFVNLLASAGTLVVLVLLVLLKTNQLGIRYQ
jgi:glycopeptide antibiotics resistance protein